MAELAKSATVTDPAYLAWARSQWCPWLIGGRRHRAQQAHHVTLKKMGRAIVRDDSALGVCHLCHRRCHGETVVVDGERLRPIPRSEQRYLAAASWKRYLRERDGKQEIPW